MSGTYTKFSIEAKELCLNSPFIVDPVQKQYIYMNTVIISFSEGQIISPS